MLFGIGDALLGGTAGARRPIPQRLPCRCPWPTSSRRRFRSISTIRRAPKSIRNIALQAKVSGLFSSSTSPDGTRRQGRRSALHNRSARFSGCARSGKGAGRRRNIAALDMRAPTSIAVHARQERLSRQGHFDQRSSAVHGRPKRPWRWTRRLSERPSSISAIPKSARRSRAARPQPSFGRHADQHRRRGAEHAGAARSDLRHVQSERDRSRRDREGARRREGRWPTFFCRVRRRRATRAS